MRVREIDKHSGMREVFINNSEKEVQGDLLHYALLMAICGSKVEQREIMRGLESLRKHGRN